MPYRIKLSKQVKNEIERLPGNVRQRIKKAVAELAYNPRPPAAQALGAELAGYYRIRLDQYRIIYTIEDGLLVVEVIRVAKRTPRTYEGLL
jgi:mRNA interferase RelE/StbE